MILTKIRETIRVYREENAIGAIALESEPSKEFGGEISDGCNFWLDEEPAPPQT
jgi:hypothetical protein